MDTYIIESEPIRYNIDDSKIRSLSDHINNGIEDGLTSDEVKTLLEWIVENTRCVIEKDLNTDISNYNLGGFCGFGQAISLLPLIQSNINVTVNNAANFPNGAVKHAFGTVVLPVKQDNKVINKWYLLDTTYRQFFTKEMCNESRFENPDNNEGLLCTPDPGYFMCIADTASEKKINFSKELTKKGYVELTKENLIMYAQGFLYTSIPQKKKEIYKYVENVDVNELKDSIIHNQVELDYDIEECDYYGYNIRIPYVNYELKENEKVNK